MRVGFGGFDGMGLLRVCLFVLAMVAAGLARAEPETLRGVALVIGNGKYEHIAPLANPASDADAVEELLSDLGFDSVRRSDRDAETLARDLERFVEDAEGADVAILYYAGHGIEAGGENWLVPVDADLSALDAAAQRLVPLSSVIERLQATVPVAIVLLDACRDNPFPPGALVKASPDAPAVPMSVAGLAPTRGGGSLGRAVDRTVENLGTVIGFAAEPGARALDGEPGGNSPYAAALIRHFEAMTGEEFGLVMRMVAEEVYLRTQGQQRPWINESLRRLLYFGDTIEPDSEDDAAIMGERRRLLLTIATTPEPMRRTVEQIAADQAVPMDALFGMMKVLDVDLGKAGADVESELRRGAERLKAIMAERTAWSADDSELARLSGLAEKAETEGAIELALRYRAEASARADELSATLDRLENSIAERRIELARTYAGHAEAASINFRYALAGEQYERAYVQVATADPAMAAHYKLLSGNAYLDDGYVRAERASLARATDAFGIVAGLADPSETIAQDALHGLANAYFVLGTNEFGSENYRRAADIYRDLLASSTPEADPYRWSTTQQTLGLALGGIGYRDRDMASLEAAAEALETSIAWFDPELHRGPIAKSQYELGGTLVQMAIIGGDPTHAEEGVRTLRIALESVDAMAEFDAAMANHWLGTGHVILARDDVELYADAIEAFEAVLPAYPRETYPANWASTLHSLAYAQHALAVAHEDRALLEAAIANYEAAGTVMTRETSPPEWASISVNRGAALNALARLTADPQHYRAAIAAWTEARDTYRENGTMDYEDWFAETIAKAEAKLE
jgi:uncharacterized caspase-like protein